MGICLVLSIVTEFLSVFTGADDRIDDIMYGNHNPTRYHRLESRNIVKIAVIVRRFML